MRNPFRYLPWVMAGLACLIGFQNCSSPANFTEAASSDTASPSTTNKCSDELRNTKVPVRVLFVVDKSGSNVTTDPVMSLRGGSIQKFFDSYKASANFSWGLIVFNSTQAHSLIGSSNASAFSGDTSVVGNAINSFYGFTDSGGTPYRAALQLATSALANDPNWTAATKYFVAFISDGVPDPAVSDGVLAQDVGNLMAAHPGQVALSTVYYGGLEANAKTRLQTMASLGSGKFMDANLRTSSTFQIDDIVSLPGVVCQ